MHKSLESKLNKFRQIIFEDLEGQVKAERQELERQAQEEFNQKMEENQKHADAFYQMRLAGADLQINKSLSEAKLAKRKADLELREYILNETLEALSEKAKGFVATPLYYQYLNRELDKLAAELKSKSLKVFHIEEDKSFLQECFAKMGIEDILWSPLAKEELGGLVIEIAEERIRYRITLKNRILEKDDYIGGVLYELLEGMEG